MDYSMIGKIEKAKRYAQERGRFEFHSFKVTRTLRAHDVSRNYPG